MSLLRAAGKVSFLTLVSRVLGLARDVATYSVFGTSWVSGVFVLAWMFPNLLRRQLGEGALSAAFVPAFARARVQSGDARARQLLASVSGALVVGLSVLCAVVVLLVFLLPPTVWHLKPGNAGAEIVGPAEVGALFQDLLAILFPYVLPVCLLAIWSGALNVLGVFSPSAAAPILLNLFWLAGLWVVIGRGDEDLPRAARIVAWFLLAGGVAQLAIAALPLRRRGFLVMPRASRHHDDARAVFLAMVPTALGMSVVQLNILFDQAIAAWMIGPEANNHVYLANRLLLFPHALVALPLATVVFPRLAELASRDDGKGLRAALDRALSLTVVLAVPAAVGLGVIASELLSVAFVHGRYTADDAVTTRWTTIMLVAGLPAIGSSQLQARALYALGDMRTPAIVSAGLVLVNATLNVVLVAVFGFGVAGLTAATSACAYLNAFVLRVIVARRIGPSSIGFWTIGRTLAASIAMALSILAVDAFVDDAGSRTMRALTGLVLPIGVAVAVWIVSMKLLRSPELESLRLRIALRRARANPPAD